MACSNHQCREAPPAVAINDEMRLFSSRPRVNGSTRDDVSYLNQDHTARTRSSAAGPICSSSRPLRSRSTCCGPAHRRRSPPPVGVSQPPDSGGCPGGGSSDAVPVNDRRRHRQLPRLHSADCRGLTVGRHIRSVRVCRSTPPPGSRFTASTEINFGVVRIDTESCP